MRAFAAGLFVIAAACSTPEGLTIEVVTHRDDIAGVILLLGEDCHDCPGFMTSPGDAPRPADMFVTTDQTIWSANVVDGVAGFRIGAGEINHVPLLLAVGVDEDARRVLGIASLHDVEVPASGGVLWRLPLHDATEIDDTPITDGERYAVWGPQSELYPLCVLVEHWSGGQATREGIVPDGDRDCDRVPEELECAPYTPNAMNVPGRIDDASCVLPVAGSLSSLCMLGGPMCNESGTSNTGCSRLADDYCVSGHLCEKCASATSMTECILAEVDAAFTYQTMPYLKCVIPLTDGGALCPDASSPLTTLDASGMLGGGSTKCEAIGIQSLDALPFPGFAPAVAIEGGKFKLGTADESCRAPVAWEGTYMPANPSDLSPKLLVADLDLDNHKHIALPLFLELLPGRCADIRAQCGLIFGTSPDSVFECVTPAPSSTSCEPEGNCAGPMCGATCCRANEQCVNGVCQCGSFGVCGQDEICEIGPAGGTCGVCCTPPNLSCY